MHFLKNLYIEFMVYGGNAFILMTGLFSSFVSLNYGLCHMVIT